MIIMRFHEIFHSYFKTSVLERLRDIYVEFALEKKSKVNKRMIFLQRNEKKEKSNQNDQLNITLVK